MARSYPIFRAWGWEIAGVLLGVGILTAITMLISYHDGRALPVWVLPLSLNALFALLSTVLRAILVVLVSQIISQRKWFGGKRERSLSDLQQFDYGSRSIYGALLLIPRLKIDPVTIIAAIVLVTSFLVGPFVQQASNMSHRILPARDLHASLPFANSVPRRSNFTAIDMAMDIASITAAPSSVENSISVTCDTGECTFPYGDPMDTNYTNFSSLYELNDIDLTTHSTVAMCSKCTNIASLVDRVQRNGTLLSTTYTLPNGFNINAFPSNNSINNVAMMRSTSNLDWLGDMRSLDVRTAARWAFVNVTFLAVDEEHNATASLCSLYPCLRTYIAYVVKSRLTEKQVRSDAMKIAWPPPLPDGYQAWKAKELNSLDGIDWNRYYAAVKSPCQADGQTYDVYGNKTPSATDPQLLLYDFTDPGGPSPSPYSIQNTTAPEQCIYRLDPDFAKVIASLLHTEVFNGDCNPEYGCRKFVNPNYKAAVDMGELGVNLTLHALYNNRQPDYSIIAAWFDNFADAMTNHLRSRYGARFLVGNETSTDAPGIVNGVAWQMTTCVEMRQNWLLLPIFLTAITGFLVVWTIAETWKERHERPVWKDSILPFIFYNHLIQPKESVPVSQQVCDEEGNAEITETTEESTPLMEINEMSARSRDLVVRFGSSSTRERSTTGNESKSFISNQGA